MVAPSVSPIAGAEQLHIGGTRLLGVNGCFSAHRKVRGAIGGHDPAIGVVPERLRRGQHWCGEAVARVMGDGHIEGELRIESDIDICPVARNDQDRLVTVV